MFLKRLWQFPFKAMQFICFFIGFFHLPCMYYLLLPGLQCRRPQLNSWVRKICWRRDRLPTPVFLGFPCGSAGKESTCNAGDLGLIPGLGRSPGEGKDCPLQCSGLENSIDWIDNGVAKNWTWLSNFHFLLPGTMPTSGVGAAPSLLSPRALAPPGGQTGDPYQGIWWGWWHWDDRLSWALWTGSASGEHSCYPTKLHFSQDSLSLCFALMPPWWCFPHLHYFFHPLSFFFGHDLSTVVYLTQIPPSLFSSACGSPMLGSTSWWLTFQENTVLLTWGPTQKPEDLKMSPRVQAELSSNPPSFTSWFCILGCRWLGFSLSREPWFPCV